MHIYFISINLYLFSGGVHKSEEVQVYAIA